MEKVCKNCGFWIVNSFNVGMGYCRRRANVITRNFQSCECFVGIKDDVKADDKPKKRKRPKKIT